MLLNAAPVRCNFSYGTTPAVRAIPAAGTTACNARGLGLGNQMAARPSALLDLGRSPGRPRAAGPRIHDPEGRDAMGAAATAFVGLFLVIGLVSAMR
jgi:hypothetical protein